MGALAPDTPGYPRIPHRKHTGNPCGTQQDPPGTTLALAQTDFHHQREAPKLKQIVLFLKERLTSPVPPLRGGTDYT